MANASNDSMNDAVSMLDHIASSSSTPKTIKKALADILSELKGGQYQASIRAANAISMLDDITQDPNMPSYVRTQLWQAVSKLEGVRD